MTRVFLAALALCSLAACGGETAGKMEDAGRIRKQVGELTTTDLEQHPIWAFALDEEGAPGQDEETVRPVADVNSVDLDDGLYVVATSFESADGTPFAGYSSPQRTEEIGYIQPTIVAESGQVAFWRGAAKPSKTELAGGYRALRKPRQELFPLRWRMTVRIEGAVAEGELPGFLYLADDTVEVIR